MARQMSRGGRRLCSVRGCGRPAYAKGMCQTHHRQMQATGKTRPIRPYRERSPGTVKLVGFRVSSECAELINQSAARRGLSPGAVISEVLEEWNEQLAPSATGARRSQRGR